MAKKKKRKHLPNPARMDPTRTTLIRRRWIAESRRRFKKLAQAVVQHVVKDDALDLIPDEPKHVVWTNSENIQNARKVYAFKTSDEKLKAFNAWFKQQVDEGIFGISEEGVDPERPWTATYVESAHRQGVVRGFNQVHNLDNKAAPEFAAGSRAQWLAQAFAAPETVAKVRMLGTRAFELLKGVSGPQAANINRILAEGISSGIHPIKLARQMTTEIGMSSMRAERIARTETIHAHAEGQLDSFEALGVEEVGIEAEWQTAGDNRVCPRCSSLSGVVLTVKEARGRLPLHPNCRCMWVPSLGSRKTGSKSIGLDEFNRRSKTKTKESGKDERRSKNTATDTTSRPAPRKVKGEGPPKRIKSDKK